MTAFSHASPHLLWGQQVPRCSLNSQKVCFSPRLPDDKRVGACVYREQILTNPTKQVCESGLDSFFELMKWEQERNEKGKEPRKVQAWLGAGPAALLLPSKLRKYCSLQAVAPQAKRKVCFFSVEWRVHLNKPYNPFPFWHWLLTSICLISPAIMKANWDHDKCIKNTFLSN